MADTTYRSDKPGHRIHRRSHLDSRQRCPARFHRERTMERHGLPHANQAALDRGTAVHACIERCLKQVHSGEARATSDVDVSDIIDGCQSDIRQEVGLLFDKWLKMFPDFGQILGVEVQMESTIIPAHESPDGLVHQIGGRMDVVVAGDDDTQGHVWDWKTAWYVPPAQDLIDDLQVIGYALMASDRYGWTTVTVNLYYPRWGVTRTITFDLDAIIFAERKIHRAILDFLAWEAEAAELGDQVRKPGKWCAGCPLIRDCDTVAPEVINSLDDFRAAGGQLLKAERQGPEIKTALARYLAHQPEGTVVEAGGYHFSLGLSGSQKIEDPEALACIMLDFGEDPWKVFNVDRTRLAAAFKRRPGLEQAVAHLVVDRRKTSVVYSAESAEE